ncbi:MAG: GEVED domain-containing protein [Chitinophagaceae bacterium]
MKVVLFAFAFLASVATAYSQGTDRTRRASGNNPVYTSKTNDAGLPDEAKVKFQQENPPVLNVVCSTTPGSLDATDPTIPGGRFFRDGAPSSCASKTCPGLFATGPCSYDTYTWTNPLCTAQCLTITVNSTSGGDQFPVAYLGSGAGIFDPNNVCSNYLGDAGFSTGGGSTSMAVNVPGLASITVVVMTVTSGGFSTYSIVFNAATACSAAGACAGTPNPGNTITSATPVCPANSFILTLQNCTPGSGVSYQWQSAPDVSGAPGTFTNAAGAPNSAVWSKTQSVKTWYRCQVTCSGNTGTSTPVFVDSNPFTNCYCTSNATTVDDEDIFNVSIGTLNNSSTCATTAPGPGSQKNRYSNYKTLTPGDIVTGNMPISVTVGTCGGNFDNAVAVWIDYNQNGAFEAAERVYVSPSTTTGPHTESGFAAIPTTALNGVTAMRVVCDENTPTGIQPCGTYSWGETEDYLVNIQPCVPLLGVTAPATVTAECSGIAIITANTGSASFPSFQWEYRVNASSPWQNCVNGGLGGVLTNVTSQSLVLINTPSTLNGYQFRAIVSNPCSAADVSTPVTTLNMVKLVARVTPTSATLCKTTPNQVQQLSLLSPQVSVCSGTLNLNVPDNTPNGTSTSLAVSGIPSSAVITEIKVTFNMTHTWVGDVVMNLKAPNGQIINLIGLLDNGTGSNGTANFTNTSVSSDDSKPPMSGAPAPRSNTFRADKFIASVPAGFATTTTSWASLLPASTINGNWTLAMCDLGPGDLGVLQNWCITISYGAPVTGIWTGPAGTMWTNSGASTPYTGTPASTIYVNPGSNAVYTVTASTTSPACVSDPVNIPVNVTQPLDLSTFVQPTNKTVCTGSNTSFSVTALSPAGSPYNGPFTYQWQETRDQGLTWTNISNGAVPGGSTATYSGATTNTLTITGATRSAPVDMNNFRYRVLVAAPPCAVSTTSNVATLTVLALPAVTIAATDLALTPGQRSTLTGTSSPAPLSATSWSWTRNGSAVTASALNPAVNTASIQADIDNLGVYRATVTDANGCTNSSNSILIESEVSDRLWIYPNPTAGQFQVRWYYPAVLTEKRRLRVYDQWGQEIMSRDIPLSTVTPHYLRMDIDLTYQPAGTYVVKIDELYTGHSVSGIVIKQ